MTIEQREGALLLVRTNASFHARVALNACKRLLCAPLPALRMTASMNYCHDHDLGLFDPEVDPEGKTGHQCATCIAMNHRVGQWVLRNESERRKRFIQELVPETFALLLVP